MLSKLTKRERASKLLDSIMRMSRQFTQPSSFFKYLRGMLSGDASFARIRKKESNCHNSLPQSHCICQNPSSGKL
uniref:Uncharacterized protein n=1 Tax=Arundo donax TaxID=35708 RepID=A0A0A9CUJ4_ARUDO